MNLMPQNLAEEKKKFLFDPMYNPQFRYEQEIPDTFLYRYGPFGGELADIAKAICDKVIERWGNESSYLEEVEGPLLSREEATKIMLQYLTEFGLEKKVSLKFSQHFIPRTHMDGYIMNIRLPMEYRSKGIRGMLHHEIDTHVYRRLNEEKQPWHEKRAQFGLRSYLETEEGLAVLHYYLEMDEPYMWIYALQYYACYLASQMSFSEVYKELRKYVDDRDRRFKITLRAKRGLTDTSLPGGYTKDQLYLRGVKKVAKWLKENEFNVSKLYTGKLSLEDIEKMGAFITESKPIVPLFVDQKFYRKSLQNILKINGFEL